LGAVKWAGFKLVFMDHWETPLTPYFLISIEVEDVAEKVV
jgi:hypothetical protein